MEEKEKRGKEYEEKDEAKNDLAPAEIIEGQTARGPQRRSQRGPRWRRCARCLLMMDRTKEKDTNG